MTQTETLLRFVRANPGATCAVCHRGFASPGIRGRHERVAHPDWHPSPELRATRAQESRDRWRAIQGKSSYWLRLSNRHAAAWGFHPLPLDTPLPVGPCAYCGGEAGGWDHVVPMSKGGLHAVANLTPCCWSCNHRKQDTDVELFRLSSVIQVRCGWCWTPLLRRRSQLLRKSYAACSRSHRNLLARWGGLAFGDPQFAGPLHKLTPAA